jgi:hypothetical protein
MDDAILKHLIGREADRILVSFRFEEFVDPGVREGGIGAEIAAHVPLFISRDHGLQDIVPAIG